MKRVACLVLALSGVVAYCAGDGESSASRSPSAPAASVPASRDAARVLRLKHLAVDLSARTITMDANVCRQSGYLEFLVCEAGTKEHESILHTYARPSDLHAALLALGLAPGKPAQWVGQGDSFRFVPPCGAGVSITIRWKDQAGTIKEVPAGKWLKVAPGREEGAGIAIPPEGSEIRMSYLGRDEDGKPFEKQAGSWLFPGGASTQPALAPVTTMPESSSRLTLSLQWAVDGNVRQQTLGPLKSRPRNLAPPTSWVFVGSEIVGHMYLADKVGPEGDGGEVISLSNFRGAVMDVPFESSNDNRQLDYMAEPDAIPSPGTPVEVVIRPLPGAEKAENARATLEIDRLGQLLIDSEPIAVDQLTDWAVTFVNRHSKAMVVIQADGMALPDDIEKARDELRLGGIRDFRVEYQSPSGYVMPRTAAQARRALEEWRKKFANPRDYIREPGREAMETLEMMQREKTELERLKALHAEYELQLRQELEKYRSSTRPSAGRGAGNSH